MPKLRYSPQLTPWQERTEKDELVLESIRDAYDALSDRDRYILDRLMSQVNIRRLGRWGFLEFLFRVFHCSDLKQLAQMCRGGNGG